MGHVPSAIIQLCVQVSIQLWDSIKEEFIPKTCMRITKCKINLILLHILSQARNLGDSFTSVQSAPTEMVCL